LQEGGLWPPLALASAQIDSTIIMGAWYSEADESDLKMSGIIVLGGGERRGRTKARVARTARTRGGRESSSAGGSSPTIRHHLGNERSQTGGYIGVFGWISVRDPTALRISRRAPAKWGFSRIRTKFPTAIVLSDRSTTRFRAILPA
jgi:hypothetical protein